MINKPCPACTGEVPKPNNRHQPSDCNDCYANSDTWTEDSKIRNCGCYAVKHDKTKLKGYEPLPEEILKLIESDRGEEKNQTAKQFYQDKLNKEIESDLQYAKDHPRVELDE